MHRQITEHFADDREDVVHSRDVTWSDVRQSRNAALADSDWRALKDVTLSAAWKEYRQALRDLPQNHDTANDAADAFPEAPE
jgi:hypothetical protein